MARLFRFCREDGSSPLIGFNWANSIDNQTMELTALGFDRWFEERSAALLQPGLSMARVTAVEAYAPAIQLATCMAFEPCTCG